ncbi:DUF4136 domain-containing protein [Chitinophaga nivalis]|uniref:DUF4136 domain-containing protein n=1 Tax=Chitinophaga nivalis TaxID=2991709 RepID=A0ABT3IG57_9BACT|nr:DUF4136 domain-containing protein [Chitinophaga nivalis]MCW3467368.1 DUF4136 domain-containing protein [Chitinophaga nivalis]MCW3482940.1 DUF4136 domain-containing protein [Chitinophaga nivalis]
MKRTILLCSTAALAVAMLSFSSCRKDPLKDMTNEESRIYITNHDNSATFSNYNTFSIVDSVAVLTNRNEKAKKALTDYDKQLIAAVTASMKARGYTLVDKAAKPDLGINLTRIDNSFTNISWNPGWWGGIGYWDTGYWGYPGGGWFWPSYYTIYQVNERQTAIDAFDLKNPKNDKFTAVWNALWRGSGVWDINNVNAMVQASFEQSPYLTKTK